jgi:AcrR family transcriptional regulator
VDLRQRRRAETQRAIQSHALRLFMERGYDSTTVADVAHAAGVSPMTLYRHFPTKEDLVFSDQYDRLIAEQIATLPAAGSLVQRIGSTLVQVAQIAVTGTSPDPDEEEFLARVRLMISTPALRARHWDSQFATQKAIVDAVCDDPSDPELEFRAWVAAATCLAAMNVALTRWAQQDGRPDLPALIADALSAAFADEFASPPDLPVPPGRGGDQNQTES